MSLIIALLGPPAAGRTTVAHFLVQAMEFSLDAGAVRRVVDGVDTPAALETLRREHGASLHTLGVEAPRDVRARRWRIHEEARAASDTGQPPPQSFEEAEARSSPTLLDAAEAVVRNTDPWLLTAQVVAVVQAWLHQRPRALFAEMIDAIAAFHRKNGFPVGDGDKETLYRHQALLSEELGEISAALTKGKGDLVEEHADLLVLALGSAVAMGWDLEEAFWRKVDKIMHREGRLVGGEMRVSAWGKDETGTLRQLARLRSLRRILHPELPEPTELDEGEHQTELDLRL